MENKNPVWFGARCCFLHLVELENFWVTNPFPAQVAVSQFRLPSGLKARIRRAAALARPGGKMAMNIATAVSFYVDKIVADPKISGHADDACSM